MKNNIIYWCNIFSILCLAVMCTTLYIENKAYENKLNGMNLIIEEIKKDDSNVKKLKHEISELKEIINLSNKKKKVVHGFNKVQLENIISNVLVYLGEKNIKDYTSLLIATAIIESDAGFNFKQIKGPAQGIFQIEPTTEKCIWNNYLKYRPELKKKVEVLKGKDIKNINALQTNISYSVAMAYLHYKRTGKTAPKYNNKIAIAEFHKKYYNTEKGKSKKNTSISKIMGIL